MELLAVLALFLYLFFYQMERVIEMKKEYRSTRRDELGKAYFKPMNPDCNACCGEFPCVWLPVCLEHWAARMADLEDRLGIS